MATEVTFSNDESADLRRRAVTLGLERRLGDAWAIQLTGGASIGGDVTVGRQRYKFTPGWMVGLSGSYRVLDGDGYAPFVLVGLAAGASSVGAERGDEDAMFTATDLRGSATVGKLFWGAIAPFATVNAFMGPIFWERGGEDITGSDDHHFQLGGGLLATAEGRWNAYAEVIPLGERALRFGASLAF
ncbi:MAG: hypothetical protein JRI68_28175 [Deltaproteobacteria bacterium]|nr:hypothetical protein [Deltaproteobacteria bacterium]